MLKKDARLTTKNRTSPDKGKDTQARRLEFATGHDRKERIRRLARLVDGFLEKPIDAHKLKADPQEIDRLRRLLDENLWERNISPYDPDWVFESDLVDIDNPDLYEPEEVMKANSEVGANTIVSVYDLLAKIFWQRFKEELFLFRDEILSGREHIKTKEDARQVLRGTKEPFDIEDFADQFYAGIYWERDSFFDLKMPEHIRVHYTFEPGRVHFFSLGIGAISAFMDLLKGLPIEIFGRCADEGCGRCFIKTSDHRRSFCSRRCAARKKQREKRQRDPEGYRKYHRNYYKRKKLAETEKILSQHRKGGGRTQ